MNLNNDFWSEGCEKLCDAGSQILLNLTGLHGDQVQDLKIDSVYQCMGLTIHNLLDLLLMCDDKNKLAPLVEKFIKTCCSIMMAVTLDVFCSWAEFQYEGEPLQSAIAGKSYLFINKYQKNPLAKELITMLGTIAQKPKTIDDLILQADVPTMISKINRVDVNQKQWFTALLNTQVLKCEKSIECIERWAHLCTVSDVTHLINMGVLSKDPRAKKLVIKCASTLDLNDLILVTIRHFHKNGIMSNFNEDLQQDLILFFNKIKNKSVDEVFCKELHLLLLQNPEQTLTYVFVECLKNSFYLTSLANAWPSLKEVLTIGDFGLNLLNTQINNNTPTEQTYKYYSELLNALISAEIFPIERIIGVVVLPLLENANKEANYQLLKNGLIILKDLQGHISVKQENEHLFKLIFEVMKNCRCTFLNFDSLKQEVVRQTVDIIEKCCDLRPCVSYVVKPNNCEDIFVSFYYKKVFESGSSSDLLKHFFPITFKKHAEIVAHLTKILPLCVTPEWMIISRSIIDLCGVEKSIELICDVTILLCEVKNSQKTETDETKCMLSALKYFLQNVGVVVKECIQPKVIHLSEDVSITRNICRMLKQIPDGNLKSEEGLSLANLLSDASLKTLKPDKKFARLVASINETHICKMLTQKILS
ncbi:uncharacterized protein LOC103315013 isoform X2 [Tribolium castaneum]|uniref:uncharacterized protein LOC103315013 isoform X2 n=1 Tax=Tribolium castaneum TaxID=7070 RepID=UPI00077DBE5C|nr:PREDICTED: uncharacterized protein LOC103315013 isoform X2 [Tribolium castaneum]|eukprot:XP_015838450.1 PREDICTED: uncharacterized protein LOC103315013 isoform X2 [Tribolium castaneum]